MDARLFEKVKIEKMKDLNLLCNYRNGAVIYLEEKYLEEMKRCVEEKTAANISKETAVFLDECGFFDEPNEIDGQAYVHVTDRCNMDCIGCYSRTSLRNVRKDLSLEDIKSIFTQLREQGISRVVISGGEPMLRADIGQIIDYGKGLGFEMAMISNGSFLIPEDTIKNLDYLSFSVDNLNNNVNQLNRVIHKDNLIKNIKTAKNAGVYVNGIVTINAFNIDDIEKYFEMNDQYGLPVTFSIFHSADKESKPFLLKDDQLKKLVNGCLNSMSDLVEGFSKFDEIFCRENCGAGKSNISVDASGNLSPCHMLHNINLGNLIENRDEAWEKMREFRENLRTPDECSSCEYVAFCGAGCKARALLTGDGTGKDPYCEMYKSYYEKQYEYLISMVK